MINRRTEFIEVDSPITISIYRFDNKFAVFQVKIKTCESTQGKFEFLSVQPTIPTSIHSVKYRAENLPVGHLLVDIAFVIPN